MDWTCDAGVLQTFLGVKIVQLLLHNAAALGPPRVHPGLHTAGGRGSREDAAAAKSESPLGPILCVCFTNHALDQFLEGLLDAGIDKVRCGKAVPPSSQFPLSVLVTLPPS